MSNTLSELIFDIFIIYIGAKLILNEEKLIRLEKKAKKYIRAFFLACYYTIQERRREMKIKKGTFGYHSDYKFVGQCSTALGETTEASGYASNLKLRYPKGTRVFLNYMSDPYAPVPPGTKGTVDYVDDAGQIHMKWDNGITLALIPGVDSFRKLTEEEINSERRNSNA